MEVSRELLFFFSALGAFNGLVLGFYFLFFTTHKHVSNRFLGLLLVSLSVRIGKSVFFYFNPQLSHTFIHIGLTFCAMIGPFLYLYLKSRLGYEKQAIREWPFHIGLTLSFMIYIILTQPYDAFYGRWQDHFLPIIYYIWLGYTLLSGYLIRNILKKVPQKDEKLDGLDIWILSVFAGNFIIWLAYKTCFYGSYIVGALSFSFVFYLLILLLFFNKKRDLLFMAGKKKYADKKIDNQEHQELLSQLKEIIEKDKIYKNSNLKLPDLADKLGILPHRLSQFLNDNLNQNFPQFINSYRIEEAKEMILTNDQFTLEGIGKECGFNSNSTFYATFKKITGTTPAQYKKTVMSA